ncbi:MAG TPA: zeta toxin family protein [Acidobacteriaceae bacterium]|nr:zeta toxin family protein [Acidobacteriaceae bacterium]
MRLSSLLDQRPIVVALAGPNGAGKSTFFDAHLTRTGLLFLNADVLALSLGIDAYEAANLANKLRRQLVEQGESFIFETVFSDPVGDKLKFLKDAERAGYTVLLIFIGISGPELSDMRVAMRVAAGGHDVPAKKLVERFPRIMHNLKRALVEISNVWVYDHSELDRGYRLVAKVEEGGKIELLGDTPTWLRPLLP